MYEIEYLDLSFNTSKVTDMGHMFCACKKLEYIKGLQFFNTNQVTNMSSMFQLCTKMKYIDSHNFNTSKVLIWDICLMNVMNYKKLI